MMNHSFSICLPMWVEDFLTHRPRCFTAPEDRMQLAIKLAGENIRNNTGGPFGAAVFDMDSGMLVSVGINRVVPLHCSIAHAEIIAIALAQQKLKTYDLSQQGRFELAASCQPCAMCLGAIPWSGVVSVLCGADEADAHAAGFDEGAKPAHWQHELQKRGIDVTENLLRDEAAAVLKEYHTSSGIIYNPAARKKI
jgi:tRNA(Arg) A34 adenosine deaminase TadA